MDEAKQKDAINEDLRAYKKLEKINNSQEFDDFFQLQITTVVQKMLSCFTGKGPQNWDEFCKIRGEVVGMLYPIQQVRGAKVMAQKLQEQLDAYYNQPAQ
jgi:hypothetical protein